MTVSNNTEKANVNLFSWLIVVLGIIPPRFVITGNNGGIFQRYYKLYASFLVFIITITGAIGLYHHYLMFLSEAQNFILFVTENGQIISAAMCTIVAILAPSFFYSSSFDAMLDNYIHIMCKTNFIEKVLKIISSKRVAIEIIVCHLIFFFQFSFNSYIWFIAFGLTECAILLFRLFHAYHNFVTMLTIYIFVKFIKSSLERTNSYLSKKLESRGIKRRKTNLAIEVLPKFDNGKICSEIRHITQFYKYLLQQTELFNKMFGCQFLFLVLSFVTGVIDAIHNIIIIFYFSDSIPVDLKVKIFLAYFIWTIWQLVIGGVVVVMCTETEKMVRNTGDICLTALINISSENERLKEELSLLNCLVNQKSPKFSAAGFFPINYTLLLSIIGSITSYVIVLIQFNNI